MDWSLPSRRAVLRQLAVLPTAAPLAAPLAATLATSLATSLWPAPALAQGSPPRNDLPGPSPLDPGDKGPGFDAQGNWSLSEAEIAALPVVSAAKVRRRWVTGREQDIAIIDARWHRGGRYELRGNVVYAGWVDWAIDPATGRWGFAGAIDDAKVPRDRWLVLFGEGPDDPAPALATSLLRAMGYDRAVWMRDGLMVWRKLPRPGFVPLG